MSDSGTNQTTRQPWEQQPGERDLHFAWFRHYLNLASSARTILSAYQSARVERGQKPDVRHPPRTWKEAFAKWRWSERATAYDNHQQMLIEEDMRDIMVARRREVIDEEWRRSSDLLAVADRISLEIHAVKALGQERYTRIDRIEAEPGKAPESREVDVRVDAAKLLSEYRSTLLDAINLRRRSVGLPTVLAVRADAPEEKTEEKTKEESNELAGIDQELERMSDEQLAELARSAEESNGG